MISRKTKKLNKGKMVTFLAVLSAAALILSACSSAEPSGVPETGGEAQGTAPLIQETATVESPAATTPAATQAAPTVTMEPEASSTSQPTEDSMSTMSATQVGEDHSMGDDSNKVEVDDQAIQDGAVVIREIKSSAQGWLVIHADNAGKQGPVIGVAPLDPGESEDVRVSIDVSQATSTLYAMLHTDAGMQGVYEFPGADTPVSAGGQVVTPAFQVMGSIPSEIVPAVVVADQAVTNNQVSIPVVISAGPGWMVIHDDGGGSPGPVLGHTAVVEGINTNVVVDLSGQPSTGTLFAMLHTDAGQVGTYEFPGADGPVSVNGQVLTPPFNTLESMNGSATSTSAPAASSSSTEPGTIMMVDTTFSPSTLTVPVGTTVTWMNNADLPHTVTADNGSFDSGTLNNGDSFQFSFTEPGTYAYHCSFHGAAGGVGMSGVIVVE